jgi:hypothetical protein
MTWESVAMHYLTGNLVVGTDPGGRISAFATSASKVKVIWQQEVGGSWIDGFVDARAYPTPVQTIEALDLAIGRNLDGTFDLFTKGRDERVYVYRGFTMVQTGERQHSNLWNAPKALGNHKCTGRIAVGQNEDGRLVVIFPSGDTFYYSEQTMPNRDKWEPLRRFGELPSGSWLPKKVDVIEESATGRNVRFRDNITGRVMSRKGFSKAIEAGNYPDYHIRVINGVRTPVSNPDSTTDDNLG